MSQEQPNVWYDPTGTTGTLTVIPARAKEGDKPPVPGAYLEMKVAWIGEDDVGDPKPGPTYIDLDALTEAEIAEFRRPGHWPDKVTQRVVQNKKTDAKTGEETTETTTEDVVEPVWKEKLIAFMTQMETILRFKRGIPVQPVDARNLTPEEKKMIMDRRKAQQGTAQLGTGTKGRQIVRSGARTV